MTLRFPKKLSVLYLPPTPDLCLSSREDKLFEVALSFPRILLRASVDIVPLLTSGKCGVMVLAQGRRRLIATPQREFLGPEDIAASSFDQRRVYL